MTKEKKQEQNAGSEIMKSIFYGTGLLCGKVTGLGKAVKTKEFSSMVKKAGKSVKASLDDMKESFEEGVKSLADESSDDAMAKNTADVTIEDKPKKVVKKKKTAVAAKPEGKKTVTKRAKLSKKKSATEEK